MKYVLIQLSKTGDLLQMHNAICAIEENGGLICSPSDILFFVHKSNGHLFEEGGKLSRYQVYLHDGYTHEWQDAYVLAQSLFPDDKIIVCQANGTPLEETIQFKNYHAAQISPIYRELSTFEGRTVSKVMDIKSDWIVLNLSGESSAIDAPMVAQIRSTVYKIADYLKIKVLDITDVRLSRYSDLAGWVKRAIGQKEGRVLLLTNDTATYHDLDIGDARILISWHKQYSHSIEYADCLSRFTAKELLTHSGISNLKMVMNNFFNWEKNISLLDNKPLYGMSMFEDLSSQKIFHTYNVYDERDLLAKRRHAVVQMSYTVLPEQDIYYKQFTQRKAGDEIMTIGEIFINGFDSGIAMGAKPKDIFMFTNTDIGLVPESLFFIRRAIKNNGGATYASRVETTVPKCLTYQDIADAPTYVGTDLFACTFGFLDAILSDVKYVPYLEMYLGNEGWDFVWRKIFEYKLYGNPPELKCQFAKLQENVCYHMSHTTNWMKESPERKTNVTLFKQFMKQFGYEQYLMVHGQTKQPTIKADLW